MPPHRRHEMRDRIQQYLDSSSAMLSRNTIAAYRLRLEDFARYLGNREATPII